MSPRKRCSFVVGTDRHSDIRRKPVKHSITITYSLMCQVCFYLGLVPLAHSLHLHVSRVHVPLQAEFLAVLRSIRFRPWLLRCYQHHYIYKHVFVAAYALPCLLREEDTPSRSSLQSTYRQAFTSFLRWLPSGHIAGNKGLEGQTGSSRKTGSPLCVSAFAKIRGGHHWD